MMLKGWVTLLGSVAVGAVALADGIVIGRLENGGLKCPRRKVLQLRPTR